MIIFFTKEKSRKIKVIYRLKAGSLVSTAVYRHMGEQLTHFIDF